MSYITNVDTLADYIDRLIVEVNKLSWLENKKREVQRGDKVDPELVTKLDNLSRDACEMRSKLKTRVNELFKDVVESGKYEVNKEIRTFSAPISTVSDLVADRSYEIGQKTFSGELAKAFEFDLLVRDWEVKIMEVDIQKPEVKIMEVETIVVKGVD